MKEMFSRTAILLGETAMEKLASSHVAVFGVGGVGGYVVEALVPFSFLLSSISDATFQFYRTLISHYRRLFCRF